MAFWQRSRTKPRVRGIECASMDHVLLHCCFVGMNSGWQVQDLDIRIVQLG
jgi:hypothetical protein